MRSKYAKINLYLTPELYEQTDAAVILEAHPMSVGDWIRKQMKTALAVKDAETQIKKAKKKLQSRLDKLSLELDSTEGFRHNDGVDDAFEKMSTEYGIPVARLKAMLDD